MTMLLATVTSTGVVGWRPHPEVWALMLGTLAIGWYTARVIQPKAVAMGHPPINRRQKAWFLLAFVGMWAVSDWPVHDVAEEQLYVVHMGQHLVLSMILPAMFLLATPRWLLQLVVQPDSRVWRVLRTGSKPVVAGLIFNALAAALHYSGLVQLSLDYAAVHFVLHLAVFTAGLLMWMPVCGPVEEWRLSPPGQIVYLFLMSVMPTVPGGWLVFADSVVYQGYDTPERLWGIDALSDQQFAGAFMKLVGGFFLWILIAVIFFRWAAAEERERTSRRRPVPAGPRAADADPLTYDEVERAFAEAGPPPRLE
jgi:putative membrane protein